jgi:hypothetical protein
MSTPDNLPSIHIGTVFTAKSRRFPSVVVELNAPNVEAHLIINTETGALGLAGGIDVSEIDQVVGKMTHTQILTGLRIGVFHGLDDDFFSGIGKILERESQKPPIPFRR